MSLKTNLFRQEYPIGKGFSRDKEDNFPSIWDRLRDKRGQLLENKGQVKWKGSF
jgi:hypothetical protein